MDKQLFRLEYHEKKGGFHFDNGTHQENTNGWITICDSLSGELCSKFFTEVETKFPVVNWLLIGRETMKKPSTDQIEKLFKKFIAKN